MKPPSSIEFVYNCLLLETKEGRKDTTFSFTQNLFLKFTTFRTYIGLATFVHLEIVCLVIKLEIQVLTFGYLELLGTGLSLWIASKDPQT